MNRKIAVFLTVALLSVSGVAACGSVQDEVRQQAEDEIQKGKTQVEKKIQQEKTNALENAKTSMN